MCFIELQIVEELNGNIMITPTPTKVSKLVPLSSCLCPEGKKPAIEQVEEKHKGAVKKPKAQEVEESRWL